MGWAGSLPGSQAEAPSALNGGTLLLCSSIVDAIEQLFAACRWVYCRRQVDIWKLCRCQEIGQVACHQSW